MILGTKNNFCNLATWDVPLGIGRGSDYQRSLRNKRREPRKMGRGEGGYHYVINAIRTKSFNLTPVASTSPMRPSDQEPVLLRTSTCSPTVYFLMEQVLPQAACGWPSGVCRAGSSVAVLESLNSDLEGKSKIKLYLARRYKVQYIIPYSHWKILQSASAGWVFWLGIMYLLHRYTFP